MGEFDLIAQYFQRANPTGGSAGADARVALGIGDDCALLAPRAGMQLAISSDMLVEGRHFLPTVAPDALGHKALAVNLSDLAACGAQPVAFTLALALPRVDEAWLQGFSHGLFALADAHGCTLVGGDTTQGPLNICITVFGEVPVVNGKSQALLRSGARPGDDVYVSGHVGDARLALEVFRGKLSVAQALFAQARERMEQPIPRVALGQALRGVASAAIDVSDGLLGDLGHILKASGCGAELAIDNVAACAMFYRAEHGFTMDFCREMTLAGGDDYELVFTAPVSARDAVAQAAERSATAVNRIGQITAERAVVLRDAAGAVVANTFASFDHFKSA
jgi:thiamine-monophosphate kinase